jgi:predicted amidohydrolase
MKYKVAAVQMEVKSLDQQTNTNRALSLLETAAAEGAKAICLPDYFLTDTPTKDMAKKGLKDIAEPVPGPTINTFAEAAKKLGVYVIAGSILEIGEDTKIYSTSAFLGPDGKLIAKVRKTHPENAPAKHELGCGVTPGPGDYPIFDTEIGKIGIMIDMDGVAVEVPRILGLKGAEVIFWPINFSARFTDGIHLMNRYNSVTSRSYLVSCCRVGWKKNTPLHGWAFFGEEQADLMYGGGTGITFMGSYLAMVADFSEGIAIATVDTERPGLVRKLRKEVMPLERRPETYSLISQLE